MNMDNEPLADTLKRAIDLIKVREAERQAEREERKKQIKENISLGLQILGVMFIVAVVLAACGVLK
jgi:hypothetical protein